jgi:hypothetical protein
MPNEISSFEPEVVEEPTLLPQIGIMADSHGIPDSLFRLTFEFILFMFLVF